LISRTYFNFEEQKQEWARDVRNLQTGEGVLRLVDDPTLHPLKVKRSAPGHLNFDLQTIARKFPEALERMDEMIEQNFKSDFFALAEDIDRESEQRLQEVLRPTIRISGPELQEAKANFGI